jgi:phosphocarrier protein FPr/phosphocarrier protein
MIDIGSPLAGWATPLESVPDPVFAERMLGDGMAVDPIEGRLIAPAQGTIVSVHAAGHAVTIELDSGPVLLIHLGLDTVQLGGAGFTPFVREGQRVNAGETLIEFDLDLTARRAPSLISPVIVTNGDAFQIVSARETGPVEFGDLLFGLEGKSGQSASQAQSGTTVSRQLRLMLAHGLHARPAGRLSKLASEFAADVEVRSPDGRIAPVRSPVMMLGLGLSHGAEITLTASGEDAEQAVAALVELLDSGMGELLPIAELEPEPTVAGVEPLGPGNELHGTVAAPGMAIGPAWQLKQSTVEVAESASDAAAERGKLAEARQRVEAELQQETEAKGPAGAIAAAQLAMLSDPFVTDAAEQLIGRGKSAAFAWRQALDGFAAPLRASNDPRFAERLDDLLDLERRVLAELLGDTAEPPSPPRDAIVLADTLYPSQLTGLAEAGIAGIATAAGGATSHAAIIAAGLGMPMLVGLGPAVTTIEDGTALVLRCDTLFVAPGSDALDHARHEASAREERLQASRGRAHELAATGDGARIEVFANLGSVAEANSAVAEGAEGCGLLRTEFLFLDRDSPPREDEQHATYQAIADALGERPLIVRTLDIGADKPAPWLPFAPEENPALGLRGIRLQLARRDLLETQLRALLAIRSPGRLKVMLPMIASPHELREVKALLDRLVDEMGATPPELGIMVETPAAALIAKTLALDAAFFSIGTNDLSQYALARDRTNPAVANGLDGLDPAVLRLIAETVIGGNAHGRPTGVCGGLAAVPDAIPILLGLGVTELSVPAAAIAETKAIVRSLNLARCKGLAAEALAAPDADAVRALVAPVLENAA